MQLNGKINPMGTKSLLNWDNANMKLLHYQANNFHIKASFNLLGLFLEDSFLVDYITGSSITSFVVLTQYLINLLSYNSVMYPFIIN